MSELDAQNSETMSELDAQNSEAWLYSKHKKTASQMQRAKKMCVALKQLYHPIAID